ncbi:MAG: hypothetical protein SWC96_04600, partial [Thermodesulfobacteriota bacterium]|nr:hypothetical protein [Thermodesulfobacteriota bacterium]
QGKNTIKTLPEIKAIKRGRFNPELFENGQNSEEIPVRIMREPTSRRKISHVPFLFVVTGKAFETVHFQCPYGHTTSRATGLPVI